MRCTHRSLLGLEAGLLAGCNTAPLVKVRDLAEEHAVASAAADMARVEAQQLRQELESARAGGARPHPP